MRSLLLFNCIESLIAAISFFRHKVNLLQQLQPQSYETAISSFYSSLNYDSGEATSLYEYRALDEKGGAFTLAINFRIGCVRLA